MRSPSGGEHLLVFAGRMMNLSGEQKEINAQALRFFPSDHQLSTPTPWRWCACCSAISELGDRSPS